MSRKFIKKIIHSNSFFESILGVERKIQYYYIPVKKFNRQMKKRESGKGDVAAVEKIKTIKDCYKNERCFIVCTGPSLTKSDLDAIRNEYTFGMNSLAMMDDWNPSFYGIQDVYVYNKMPIKIREMPKKCPVFLTQRIFKSDLQAFVNNSNVYVIPVFCSDHLINPESDKFEFSKDCYIRVYDGFSITISLIQIAYYMGFREIYLIGADCNYSKEGQNHFIEYGHRDPYAHRATNRNIRMYELVKEFADQNGLEIFNATRGGMLEVFPRVDLDEMNLK